MNKTLIDIRHTDEEITGSFTIIGNPEDLISLLHQIFRASPEFKATVTESLLTFDLDDQEIIQFLELHNPDHF